MNAIQQMMTGLKSLGGSMFGGAGSPAGSGMASAMNPMSAMAAGGDPLAMAAYPGSGGSTAALGASMDPMTMSALAQQISDPFERLMAMQMLQNQPSKWGALAQGLAPMGNTLLDKSILGRQPAPQAPATHGAATAPPPLQFAPTDRPLEPLETAQLIARLL